MKGKYKKRVASRAQREPIFPQEETTLTAEPTANNAGRKKRLGKKRAVIISVTAVAVVASLTLGLCLHFLVFKKKIDYFDYFNDFSSSSLTKAVCLQNLSYNTFVSSFDPQEEIFVTAREYMQDDGTATVLYGLASADKEYILPAYPRIEKTFGDYAIVARYAQSSNESASTYYIDLIRYKGTDNAPYSLMREKSVIYNSAFKQLSFIGDYIAVYGSLDESSQMASFTTFYDYKSGNELLEAFKLRACYDSNAKCSYKYVAGDGFLAAYSTDKAYFYNMSDAPVRGYLEPVSQGEYTAFSDMSDSLGDYVRDLSVYYMGNGWFVRNARLSKSEPFRGFNLILSDSPTSNAKYARTKTDFFNAKTGKAKNIQDIPYIAGVANKFNSAYYAQQSYYLGGLKVYDGTTGTYGYSLPFADPASMVKDGYSVLYYYYTPYLEDYADDNKTYYGYTGETTYCLMDENLNRIQPSNALMPTAFVDGVGWQTSDPEYTESTGTAYVYDRYMKSTVVAPFIQNTAAYIPYYATKDACIVCGTLRTGENTAEQLYAAITPSGRRITDFVYSELSYFSGGYAVGSKTEDGRRTYFRIDLNGNEVKIDDLDNVYQGMYTYKDGNKIGLKNYAGDILIEAASGTVNAAQISMTRDGRAIKTYVALTKDGQTKIYALE